MSRFVPVIAPDALVKERLAICAACPKRIHIPPLPDRCRVCGCFLALKVRLPSEHCPERKW